VSDAPTDNTDRTDRTDRKKRREPVAPVPASTMLLLRDGVETLEVFMVERHHQIDFAEGALVFPGGKTERSDGAAALRERCRQPTGIGPDDLSEDELAVRIGGIRETFEECGVLLARPRGQDALVGPDRLVEIEARHREPLHQGERTMLEFVEAEDLELALDKLVFYAHWVTPEFMPKRFDTFFFLVDAPTDQLAVHDGSESVDSLWTTIPNALELEKTGQRTIIFPTLENIKKLGRSSTVDKALAAAAASPIFTVLPRTEKDAEGNRFIVLPEEAGYDTVRARVDAPGARMPAGAPRS